MLATRMLAAANIRWKLVGTFASDNTSSESLPAAIAEGDIVLVVCHQDNSAKTVTSTGYTTIYSSGGSENGRYYYKVMGASPDGTITFNQTDGIAIGQVWRGVNTSTPLDVTSTTATGVTGMPNPPSITPTTDGCLIVIMGALDDDSVESSVTAPSGFENILKQQDNSFVGTVMMATYLQSSAGAIDPDAFGGTGTDDWSAVTVALRPAW